MAIVFACSGIAQAQQLGKGAARSAAESKAYDYVRVRPALESSDTRKCVRRTVMRVDCEALATGVTEARRITCRLVIEVRAVERRYYWDEVAKIAQDRCRTTVTPRLEYADARSAIQSEADRFAGTLTTITSLYRQDLQTYTGRSEWSRVNPTGCKGCGYNPVTDKSFDTPETESCSVSMKATLLRPASIKVETEESACY